jgi:adenylylsulfate kinase-like enzyme
VYAAVLSWERRAPNELSKRARRGEIAEFTGVSAPYEEPDSAELIVDTATHSIEDSVRAVVDYVERNFTLTES